MKRFVFLLLVIVLAIPAMADWLSLIALTGGGVSIPTAKIDIDAMNPDSYTESGGVVSAFTSQGTLSFSCASTGTKRPALTTSVAGLNSRPAFTFDGVDDEMDCGTGVHVDSAQSATTIFVGVLTGIGNSSYPRVFGLNRFVSQRFGFELIWSSAAEYTDMSFLIGEAGTPPNRRFPLATTPISYPHRVTVIANTDAGQWDTSAVSAVWDGSTSRTLSDNSGAAPVGGNWFGRSSNGGGNGAFHLGRFLFYQPALTTEQRTAILAQITSSAKWGN